MEKACNKCSIVQPLTSFHKCKNSLDGCRDVCKECRKKETQKYLQENHTAINERRRQHRLGNIEHYLAKEKISRDKLDPEKVKAYNAQYRTENREQVLAQKRQHYYDNKEAILKKQKAYNKLHKRTEYYRNYVIAKYRNNLEYRLQSQLAHRIRAALKYQTTRKAKSHNRTYEMIGCTIDGLKRHLEKQFQPGMTWSNWTYDGWHIDHARPCASFNLTDPEEQTKCFHFTNLQPLWAEDNLSKGARILEPV